MNGYEACKKHYSEADFVRLLGKFSASLAEPLEQLEKAQLRPHMCLSQGRPSIFEIESSVFDSSFSFCVFVSVVLGEGGGGPIEGLTRRVRLGWVKQPGTPDRVRPDPAQ